MDWKSVKPGRYVCEVGCLVYTVVDAAWTCEAVSKVTKRRITIDRGTARSKLKAMKAAELHFWKAFFPNFA